MKRIIIGLEDNQRVQLESLSLRSHNSMAALIRWCIKNSLSTLTANLEAGLKRSQFETVKQYESTID